MKGKIFLRLKFMLPVLITLLYISATTATEPPRKGVTIPKDFEQLKQNIAQSYGEGYYAQKMSLRKALRDRIAKGEISEQSLVADTVFALVLLGKYSNSTPKFSAQNFQEKLFDGPNPTGTMTQFYKEISYDQMFFTGNCKGWYQVPGTLESYVGTNNGLGTQGGPQFVFDLVKAADADINFANYIQYYDTQGNPRIGMIAGVHTGGGAEAGATNIWSHKWTFGVITNNQPYTTNDIDPKSGKYVLIDGTYACEPELSGSNNTGGNLIDIGVFCHEFGHVFGLPDLYDTDNSSEGLGQWCLMASGSWGGNGNTPQTPTHMSAWCKQKLGWVTPTAIDSLNSNLEIHNVEQNAIIYKMWKLNQAKLEYFLVENRQKIGFDKNLPNSGLLIYHVDDSKTSNTNENHYWVDVEQADGNRDLNKGLNRGDAGDPFPGSSNNNKFDVFSIPSSNGYTTTSFVSVRNIHSNGSDMIGDLDVGTRPYLYGPTSFYTGNLEIPDSGIINLVKIKSYGLANLIISDISKQAGPFKITDNFTFPLSLVTYDSITLHISFTPTQTGLFEENISVASNDPMFTGIKVMGRGYKITPAQNNTLYACSGATDSGKVLTINPQTGTGTNLGLSLYNEIKGISVNPKTHIIYGLAVTTAGAEFLRINATGGDAYNLFTVPISNMTAIAFDTAGNFYAATRTGGIYSVNVQGKTISQICSTKVQLTAIAFNPKTNELIGTPYIAIGSNKDRIFRINRSTGDTTNIGKTGFTLVTIGIAFDDAGELFGINGTGTAASNFFSIDKNTGTGTLIGAVGLNGITGIAFSSASATSVKGDKEIPHSFSLKQNYPNPFNPSTSIEYSIPTDSYIKITIYNLLGEVVDKIVDTYRSAGKYKITWDGSGRASGIYFYELSAKNNSGTNIRQVKKLILLK
jgi:M6 family metalloprotease-like protein